MDQTIEKEWTTEAGLTGLVVLCDIGTTTAYLRPYRNGYVELGPDHPLRDVPLGDIDGDIEAPGGLTWKGELTMFGSDRHWVGFDHAHSWDMEGPPASLEQVVEEVEALAHRINTVDTTAVEDAPALPAGGYEEAWKDESMRAWVHSVLNDMAPKMRDSALVCQLVPDGEDGPGDVKFWVELGASIMMDKPIVAVAVEGRLIPAKLRLIADEIVTLPDGVSPEASDELAAAFQRVLDRRA